MYSSLLPSHQDEHTQYDIHVCDVGRLQAYSDVMDRASRWVSSQESVTFISLRSINVKLKKSEISIVAVVVASHVHFEYTSSDILSRV